LRERQAAERAKQAACSGDYGNAYELLRSLIDQHALPRAIDISSSSSSSSSTRKKKASSGGGSNRLGALAHSHFSMMSTLFDAAVALAHLDTAMFAAGLCLRTILLGLLSFFSFNIVSHILAHLVSAMIAADELLESIDLGLFMSTIMTFVDCLFINVFTLY
jgi:hypothetical protein